MDFVVIGGVAVQAHGYIRSTRDLDVIARPTMLNLSRLSEALAELGAEPRGRTARESWLILTCCERAPHVPVMTTVGPLDVINVEHVAGAPRSYDALREQSAQDRAERECRSPSPACLTSFG